jgi:hypothetical protein
MSRRPSNVSSTYDSAKINVAPTWILGKDLMLVLFIIPSQEYDYIAGLLCSQDVLFTWCWLYNLSRLGNPVWTLPKVFGIGFLLSILNIVCSWIFMSEVAFASEQLTVFYIILISVTFISYFAVIAQWIYYIWNLNYETTDMLTFLTIIQASVFIFFFALYLLIDFSNSYSQAVVWTNLGINYLTTWVYAMTGCTACVSVISGRVSKFGNILLSNVRIYTS